MSNSRVTKNYHLIRGFTNRSQIRTMPMNVVTKYFFLCDFTITSMLVISRYVGHLLGNAVGKVSLHNFNFYAVIVPHW